MPWLLVLAVVLPVLFFFCSGARAGRGPSVSSGSAPSPSCAGSCRPTCWGRAAGVRLRLGAAALLAGIALAGPRWGVERTTVRSTGVDLVLAVDASLSMLATDERPSRLERVKQEIRRLRALSPGDRVGLLAFAGRSYVLSPITVDGGALDLFLDNLDPSVVGQAGSSIAQTIAQGTSLLALTKSGADRALVIMSDGEAFEPQDEILASARRREGAGGEPRDGRLRHDAGLDDSRFARGTASREKGRAGTGRDHALQARGAAGRGCRRHRHVHPRGGERQGGAHQERARQAAHPVARVARRRGPHAALSVVPPARRAAALARHRARRPSRPAGGARSPPRRRRWRPRCCSSSSRRAAARSRPWTRARRIAPRIIAARRICSPR